MNGGGDSTVVGNKNNHGGYAIPSGWMYVNESGQMCGPYIQQQLFEGLSTGFLPEDLPVYPVIGGKVANSVPLKFFRQFPDHVATGFAYLSLGAYTVPSDLLQVWRFRSLSSAWVLFL